MLPAVDHLVYAVLDLEDGVEALAQQLGVRPEFGGKHTGRGTHNALISLGRGKYLEVIAPDPDQPPPADARPFGLDNLHEPGLVAWAIAVNDITTRAQLSREAGYDPGAVMAMSRRLPDGGELRWHLTLRLVGMRGGLVPFLIEWESAENHPSRTAPGGCSLVDLTAEHPRPDEISRQLAALGVDLPLAEAPRAALIATIEGPNGTVVLT
jgi:hypothetical protein